MIESNEKNFYDDNEINEIINYLSYDLILENLKKQISKDEGYGDINYLEVFNEKFNYIILTYGNNQEIVNKITELKHEFYLITLNAIEENFGFKMNFKDIILREELYNIISIIYKFFIINFNNTLISFYSNYIRKESKSIIKAFKNQINYKDLYFTLLKKKLNKESSIIIFSIGKIIDTIEFEYIEDFIDLVIKNDVDEYDNYIINKLFNSEEFIDDLLCDINKFKEIVKTKIKEDITIQQSVKSIIFEELAGKED